MFFAGMALGAMAGAALGIGIMCCVVAGKQEDQRMEQIRIRRQKQGEPKQIQFRDMEGIERQCHLVKALVRSLLFRQRYWNSYLCLLFLL